MSKLVRTTPWSQIKPKVITCEQEVHTKGFDSGTSATATQEPCERASLPESTSLTLCLPNLNSALL